MPLFAVTCTQDTGISDLVPLGGKSHDVSALRDGSNAGCELRDPWFSTKKSLSPQLQRRALGRRGAYSYSIKLQKPSMWNFQHPHATHRRAPNDSGLGEDISPLASLADFLPFQTANVYPAFTLSN